MNRILKGHYDAMKMKCIHAEEGCTETCTIGQLQQHLSVCTFHTQEDPQPAPESTAEQEAESEDEEDAAEEEGEEEEMSIEDMDEDDLKHFIEDVIKDMVSAGELEAGHEGMENEEGEEEEGEEIEAGEEEEIDEEINIDELLAEIEGTNLSEEEDLNEVADLVGGLTDPQMAALVAALGAGLIGKLMLLAKKDKEAAKKAVEKALADKSNSKEMEEQLDELRSELNEVNLLNAKLLYTNKIFRNKSLNETQKVKVLTAFDKASTKKEVELVYETLLESLKTTTKAPIKESMSSASKVLGGTTSKPIIENDAFARMRELAFGRNK